MILFGEYNVTFGAVIKILRIKFLFKHGVQKYEENGSYSSRLIVQPMDLVSCVAGVAPLLSAVMASLR